MLISYRIDVSAPSHDFTSGDYETPPSAGKIVIADDDPSIVNLLRENFQMQGHQVLWAYDGQTAIRLARVYLPDLIILDVNMPMTNGLKAFEFLRATPETAKIPVIFITGEKSQEVYEAIADASRVAYVKKPFDLDGLNSLVREFLQKYPVIR